ncbi:MULTISPECIES: GtrA family protein [Desulfosediminicola]|uniref:GtrA family protein n=1 Tax=Desulfosediminicola TaxID=2886823 RepID=UPI0010AD2D66|nr:GtrA family protein [Desulfosediminicola ganghwensis]
MKVHRQHQPIYLSTQKLRLSFSSYLKSDFIKFAAVGVIGTLLNLVIMAAMVEVFTVSHLYASAIATEISIIHNFLLNNYWTFGARNHNGSLLRRFVHFNTLSLGTLVVNVYVSLFFADAGTHYLLAQSSGILSAFAINYLVNNYLIFSNEEGGAKQERAGKTRLDIPA